MPVTFSPSGAWRSLPAILVSLSIVILPGCGLSVAASGDAIANDCTDNTDCSNGLCDAIAGICISETSELLPFMITVVPLVSGSSAVPSQYFGPYTLDGPFAQNLQLEKTVHVIGTVVDSNGEQVPAHIEFQGNTDIQGEETRTYAKRTYRQPLLAFDDTLVDYSTTVIADGTYRIRVEPEDSAQLPPLEQSWSNNTESDFVHVDITYPIQLDSWSGKIVDTVGNPRSGIQAKAIHPETGVLESNITTSNSNGVFTLLLRPHLSEFAIQLDGGTAATPTVVVNLEQLWPGNTPSILMPDFTTRILSGSVLEPEGEVIAGAKILTRALALTDPTTNVSAEHQSSVQTSADGTYSLALPVGQHAIAIVPPPDSRNVAIFETTIDVDDPSASGDIQTMDFQLNNKSVVEIKVSSNPETIADSVTVNASSISKGSTTQLVDGRSSSGTFLGNGAYQLQLDPVAYDIQIQPESDTGYGWLVWDSSSHINTSLAGEFAFPVPVQGAIEASNGSPLTNAIVEIQALDPRSASGVPDEQGWRFITIGRGTTDEQGSYSVLVSPFLYRE